MRRTILGALLLLGCNSGGADDGLGGGGPDDGAGGNAGAGSGGTTSSVDCVKPEEMIPVGCAVPRPDLGECVLVAKDEDGDGFPGECEVPVTPGVTFLRDAKDPSKDWDCDDKRSSVNPEAWDGPPIPGRPNRCNDDRDNDCSGIVDDGRGDYEGERFTCTCSESSPRLACRETSQGTRIDFPGGTPKGECRWGARLCDDGRWEECNGAVGPRPETCAQYLDAPEKDYDCDGKSAAEELEDPEDGVVDTRLFYCDADGDGRLAEDRESVLAVLACAPPETGCGPDDGGTWIEKPQSSAFADCDDEDPDVGGKNRTEICDGKDNDCDESVDENITFDNQLATFECDGGLPSIVSCPSGKLSCDEDILGNGCETDIGLDHCYDCNVACDLMCSEVAEDCATIQSLALGEQFSCGLMSDGRIACWGEGSSGQLGDGQGTDSQAPVLVLGVTDAQAIAAGSSHLCFTRQNGDVHCFGDGDGGQLDGAGQNNVLNPELALPVAIAAPTLSLGLGQSHSCAITTNHQLRCWGTASNGQLGDGGTALRRGPSDAYVLDEEGYEWIFDFAEEVSAGRAHTCARTTAGTVFCAGDWSYGQIGKSEPAFGESGWFEAVPGLSDVSSISSGTNHSCAVSSGKVYCWGENTVGQVGQASGSIHSSPEEVVGIVNAVSVSCGAAFSCARLQDGTVQCWGANTEGELGSGGPSGFSSSPVAINGVSEAHALRTGDAHACVQKADGSALCWGHNLRGQLGRQGGPAFDPIPSPLAAFSASAL